MVAAGKKRQGRVKKTKKTKDAGLVVITLESEVLCLDEILSWCSFCLGVRLEMAFFDEFGALVTYALTQCSAPHSPIAQTQGRVC